MYRLTVHFGGLMLLLTHSIQAATNPTGALFEQNMADPSIIKVGDTYWAFGTPGQGDSKFHLVVAKSNQGVQEGWSYQEKLDVFPHTGDWTSDKPSVWAPDVSYLADKDYYLMYYSARPQQSVSNAGHCVGAATAKNIEGPYSPLPKPLVCGSDHGKDYGAIDGNGFVDTKGVRYFAYKQSHLPDRPGSKIHVQPVGQSGYDLHPEDDKVLLTADEGDGEDTEAPILVNNPNGGIVLFYSNFGFKSEKYSVSYAVADNLEGQFTRKGALLKTGENGPQKVELTGPGSGDVVSDHGQGADTMVFHAIDKSRSSIGQNVFRQMHAAKIEYHGKGSDATVSLCPGW